MSWKLAEMRWRHELGLSERGRDRESVAEEDDKLDTKTNELQRTRRGRSYTAPCCREVLESNVLESNVLGFPVNTTIQPDPMLALSSGISGSSTTPLLKRTQSATKVFEIHELLAILNKEDITEPEASLCDFQPAPFRHKPNPVPQLDSVQKALQVQGGSSFFPLVDDETTDTSRRPDIVRGHNTVSESE